MTLSAALLLKALLTGAMWFWWGLSAALPLAQNVGDPIADPPEWIGEVPPSNRGAVIEMSEDERTRYIIYKRNARAARESGDKEAAWRLTEQYVEEAAPSFVRDACLMNLADRRAQAADPAGALRRYEQMAETGSSRRMRAAGRNGRIRTLLKLGRRDEAEAVVLAIPQHGVGGLRSFDDVVDASFRSRFLITLGKTEEAQQSFLSQSPDAGDVETKRHYLAAARRLAQAASLRAGPREALGLHTALMRRHPDVVSPEFLQEVYFVAESAGDDPVRDMAFDLAVEKFPAAPATTRLTLLAATDAAQRGDAAAAELMYRRVLTEEAADPRERNAAAERLRALGVEADPVPLAPAPDPAFGSAGDAGS